MDESIYSGSNDVSPNEDEPHTDMASFASLVSPFFGTAAPAADVAKESASRLRLETASFSHALVALAAKLASVDGTPNKAEYAAFHSLFVESESAQAAQLRSLFVKRVTDTSPALQYARQIFDMTKGEPALHLDLFSRLVQVATADAALNAAELELLRAVADIFTIDRETFRHMIAKTLVPVGASPYDVLGVSARASDQELRDQYMARVQMLHPDRYHAAGASAETIAMLSDQLAAVNAAYRAVQNLRAKKSQRSEGSFWKRKNAKGARVD